MNNKIKILTFNAGLLEVKLFGKPIIQPAPYVEERLKELPARLIKTQADIICLQEVYRQEHRDFLISQIKKYYPYHFYSRQSKIFRLENSLMFFSKFPFLLKKVVLFKNETVEEKLFAYKGVLIAKIDFGENKEIIFYNTHTTAGGIRDPQNNKVENIRNLQIYQIIKSINKNKKSSPVIIVGDFNTGPEVSKTNYEIFEKFGFVDTYRKYHPNSSKVTWDPLNKLNINGPHKNCPPQRIDHIFLNKEDCSSFQVASADIVFDKPCVKINAKEKVTLSDHYGLLIDLKIN